MQMTYEVARRWSDKLDKALEAIDNGETDEAVDALQDVQRDVCGLAIDLYDVHSVHTAKL